MTPLSLLAGRTVVTTILEIHVHFIHVMCEISNCSLDAELHESSLNLKAPRKKKSPENAVC